MLAHTARCLRTTTAPARSSPVESELTATQQLAEHGDGVPLTDVQVDRFGDEGVIALPGILPTELNHALRADVDAMAGSGLVYKPQQDSWGGVAPGGGRRHKVVAYEHLGGLCSLPCIIEKVKQLMAAYGNAETACAMHHIHGNRQAPGTESQNWHQDYEQLPQMDRAQLMVLTRRGISDCHFAVLQLNHFIPGYLSYSVAVFRK
jgi:hypothetical protein